MGKIKNLNEADIFRIGSAYVLGVLNSISMENVDEWQEELDGVKAWLRTMDDEPAVEARWQSESFREKIVQK